MPAGQKPVGMASGGSRSIIGPGTVLLLCALVGGAALLTLPDPLSGDDVAHYQIARYAIDHPHLLLDIWGRPGFTLLHVLPAQIGWTGCRLFSLALALLTAGLVALCCRGLGRHFAALGAGFTFFQTWAFELSIGSLTESVYAAFLALGLCLVQRGRPAMAALAFSWTAITRLEGLPLLGVFALWFLLRGSGTPPGIGRRMRHVALLGTFPLLWVLACFAASGFGEPLALLTRNPYMQAGTGYYGSGSWWYFIALSPYIHGPAVLALALLGIRPLLRSGQWLAPAFLAAFYLLQSVLWSGGLFATAGYPRFFASVAPPAGILAAWGAHRLASVASQPRFYNRRGFGSALLLLSAVLSAGHSLVLHHFHDGNFAALRRAAQVVREHGGVSEQRPICSGSAYLLEELGLDPWDRQRVRPFRRESIEAAPVGSFVVYAAERPGEGDHVHPADFFVEEQDPEVLRRRAVGRNYVHLLRRTRPAFRELADLSLLRRVKDDEDAEPWPFYVKVFVKLLP